MRLRKPADSPGEAPPTRRRLLVVRRQPEASPAPLPPEVEEASLVPEQCLNCGALVTGTFCAECGQEHSHKVVSLGRLVSEFLGDTLSLDSKLLKTVLLLLFRPGYLTNEYNAGRRVRYLSPWRMYVFSSLVLFFVLSLKAPPMSVSPGEGLRPASLRATVQARGVVLTWAAGREAATYKVKRAASEDGPFKDLATGLTSPRYVDASPRPKAGCVYTVTAVSADGRRATSDPLALGPGAKTAEGADSHIMHGEIRVSNNVLRLDDLPDSVEEYEAAQARLAPADRAGWLEAKVARRAIEFRNSGAKSFESQMAQGMLDSAPKAMMVLVPLFALILKMMYLRRSRLYIEHLVFALHTHAFAFAVFSVEAAWRGIVSTGAVSAGIGLYLLLAMRAVYRQSWLKTLAKFGFIITAYSVILVMALVGIVLATVLIG